jgi:hypothetical protein
MKMGWVHIIRYNVCPPAQDPRDNRSASLKYDCQFTSSCSLVQVVIVLRIWRQSPFFSAWSVESRILVRNLVVLFRSWNL